MAAQMRVPAAGREVRTQLLLQTVVAVQGTGERRVEATRLFAFGAGLRDDVNRFVGAVGLGRTRVPVSETIMTLLVLVRTVETLGRDAAGAVRRLAAAADNEELGVFIGALAALQLFA